MGYCSINLKGLRDIGLGLLAVCFLLSCSHNNSGQPDDSSTALNTSACSGNRYLQKFNCSLDRVEAAAQDGDPDAQYALGYMYYYGIGTVRDTTTATLWIRRSALQGQPIAKKALALITGGAEISTLHHEDPKANMVNNSAAPQKPLHEVLPNYRKATVKTRAYEGAPPLSKKAVPHNEMRLSKSVNTAVATRQSEVSSQVHQFARTAMESSLMSVNPSHYTLQLMGTRDQKIARGFIAQNHLQKMARYYQVKYNGHPWYRVVYGDFKTLSQADLAAHGLSSKVRAQKPWIKRFSSVQNEIRSR